MNTNNLNTALYEKMATEQEKYRDWLKSQPPEEILHHTYEYTVREDTGLSPFSCLCERTWGNGTVQPLISGEQRLQRSH